MKTEPKTIHCPDFGDVLVNSDLIGSQIFQYEELFGSKPQDAADNLLLSTIDPAITLGELSENDRVAILKAIITEFDLLDAYENAIEANGTYFDAFRIAFEESGYSKGLKSLASSLSLEISNPNFSQILGPVLPTVAIVAAMNTNPIKPLIPDFAKMYQATDEFKIYKITEKVMASFAVPNFAKTIGLGIANKLFKSQEQIFNYKLKENATIVAAMGALYEPERNAFTAGLSAISMQQNSMRDIFGQTSILIASIQEQITLVNQDFESNITDITKALELTIQQSRSLTFETGEYFRTATKFTDLRRVTKPETNQVGDEIDEIFEGKAEAEEMLQSRVGITQSLTLELVRDHFASFEEFRETFSPTLHHIAELLKPKTIFEVVKEFGKHIQKDTWKLFWSTPGDKFNSCPEGIGQGFLSMFLVGKYGELGFVGRELQSGAGFIDVIVTFFGLEYLFELKMLGVNYPFSYAKSGIAQLNSYMGSHSLKEAHLIVFDGRKTETGKKLKSKYKVENGIIHVTMIKIYHVAPTTKDKSR